MIARRLRAALVVVAIAAAGAACRKDPPPPGPAIRADTSASAGPAPDAPPPPASAEGSAMGVAAHACPTRLPAMPAPGGRLPLDTKPDVPALIQAGKEGHPQRVRLRFRHPIASCDCPRFITIDYEAKTEGAPIGIVQAVFPAPLPEAHRYAVTAHWARTQYEVTGYFTGREIDTYEWHRLQYGTEATNPGDEERATWPEKYPELCVESYCVVPDLVRDCVEPFYRTPEFLAKYKDEIKRMRADGVKLCSEATGR
jgi:hypothetical protein